MNAARGGGSQRGGGPKNGTTDGGMTSKRTTDSDANGGGALPALGAKRDAPAGLAVLDSAGRVVFMDTELATLLGGNVSELVGHEIFRFVEDHQRPAARQALRRAARTGRVGPAVWLARGAGPRRFIMSLQGRALAGKGGEPLYVVVARARPQRSATVHRQALLASIAQECDEAIMSSGPGGLIEILEPRRRGAFRLGRKGRSGCSGDHDRP